MAAVSFYRFAAAMMELLEPDKYSFSRKVAVEAEPEVIEAKTTFAVPVNTTASLVRNTELSNLTSTNLENFPISVEAESETVATVAEHLTNAIAKASDESLVRVATAIQEAAAETLSTVILPAAVTQITETISDPDGALVTATEAVQLVQATVATLATQATKEIRETETLSTTETFTDPAELVIKTLENKATEVITAAITDKIEREVKLNTLGSSITDTEDQASELSSRNDTSVPENLNKSTDFWELFPEMAVSDVKYLGTVSYLYGFMSDNNLFDALNPERGFDERYSLMTKFIGDASEQRAIETRTDNILAETRNESEKSREQISELEHKTIEETSRLERSTEMKQAQERQERLVREREKLNERIASERLKALM